ncbi:hypothetical protein ID866_1366 [Astraeus odoratus]|nr:hypothetical protein ID866_1366 [Astraeus odoratus]
MDKVFQSIVDRVKVDVVSPNHEAENAKQLEIVSRSFISDTITVPTKDMYDYAVKASLGDDVYHEPSTHALEVHMAQLTGKEAALLVSSGTMGNQLAIRTHLRQPPFSVICDVRSHINNYEAGGAAIHTGALVIPLMPSNGRHLTLKDIRPRAIFGEDVHSAPTRLICLENTLDGLILPLSDIIEISEFAHQNNVLMHLDGARLWHVAAETHTNISELCEPFDSISLCFSKGLGAPIGTCLVGSKAFIQKARWFRKAFGGGMRQTGILAGAVAYALTNNFPRLPRVHALAKRLQQRLEDLGVDILCPVETCMVFYDPAPIGITYEEVEKSAAALSRPIAVSGSRLVLHIQTTEETVDDFLSLLQTLKAQKLTEEVRFDIHTETQDADNDANRAEISRTFISDTVTTPTKEMNEYAIRATLGDDVFFEPSTSALESHIAKLTGKEARLFMPTGTMSNQVALQTHLQQPPFSVVCDARAHVYRMEAGGIAFHSGANVIPIFSENDHHLTWEDIEPRIVTGADVHTAPTRVISLENTLNGTVILQRGIIEISENARKKGIVMRLDGARIWHVPLAAGLSMRELCEPFDSASLCLSKGLGAPIDTCLVGSKSFITKARWFRKLFGGGIRQTGYMAAATVYALTHNFPLLLQVHGLAKRMQRGLEEIGVGILSPAETCMLFYGPSPIGVEYWEVVERAAQLPNPIYLNGSRLIMYIQTSPQAVEDFLELMKTLRTEKEQPR